MLTILCDENHFLCLDRFLFRFISEIFEKQYSKIIKIIPLISNFKAFSGATANIKFRFTFFLTDFIFYLSFELFRTGLNKPICHLLFYCSVIIFN